MYWHNLADKYLNTGNKILWLSMVNNIFYKFCILFCILTLLFLIQNYAKCKFKGCFVYYQHLDKTCLSV